MINITRQWRQGGKSKRAMFVKRVVDIKPVKLPRISDETKNAVMPIAFALALKPMYAESGEQERNVIWYLNFVENACIRALELWPESAYILESKEHADQIINAFDKLKEGAFKEGHNFSVFVSHAAMLISDWLDERREKMKKRHSDKLQAMSDIGELLFSVYAELTEGEDYLDVTTDIEAAKQAATELLIAKGW